jgi:hypothetical protein
MDMVGSAGVVGSINYQGLEGAKERKNNIQVVVVVQHVALVI